MSYRASRHFYLGLITVLVLAPVFAGETEEGNWPSFRGHRAGGVGAGHATVTTWNVDEGTNVLWKTSIPGLGHSSPVIWGNQLFVTTAIAESGEAQLKVGLYGDGLPADDNGVQSWRLISLDKNTGKILWQVTSREGEPKIRRHPKASHANSTPATDGKRLVAFYGSEGLYCYGMDGKLLWKKDLGVLHSGSFMLPAAQWGFGSSPVLHDGKVVVQADILKGSFLAVFDAADGKEVWRSPRDEFPTWSTPTVFEDDERTLVVVNGFKHMGAYDFATGGELWRLAGGGDVPVPTPVAAHGLIYLTNAHGSKRPVYAIRPGAEGDVSLADDATANDGVVWSVPRGGAYMTTPLAYGDELYVCRNNGVVYCYDARTGEKRYETRMASGEGFTASPVAAHGKVYFSSETGDVHVVKRGAELEKLAVNAFDETLMASPAISKGKLYFRTRHHLVAIGSK